MQGKGVMHYAPTNPPFSLSPPPSASRHRPLCGGVGLAGEQDEPLDPLNIGRNRPGTVIPGTRGAPDLLKQFGPGMIFRIIPVHTIGIF